MIVVRVELWSAVTGDKTELARMHICNVGGSQKSGDYDAVTFRGRSKEALDRQSPLHRSSVRGYARQSRHVWNLVVQALREMGYGP